MKKMDRKGAWTVCMRYDAVWHFLSPQFAARTSHALAAQSAGRLGLKLKLKLKLAGRKINGHY